MSEFLLELYSEEIPPKLQINARTQLKNQLEKSLEEEGIQWAKEILEKSPLAIRLLKSAFNAELDGQAGIQELAGNATLLYYMSEEAQEGKNAYVEKRKPDFSKFPRVP